MQTNKRYIGYDYNLCIKTKVVIKDVTLKHYNEVDIDFKKIETIAATKHTKMPVLNATMFRPYVSTIRK